MYEYFGGVTRILVPDNTMTAVIYNNDWYNQELNTIYHEMAEHYNTAIIPARVRAPKDRPNAEGSVGVISTWITAALRNEQFFSLAELNQAIRRKLKEFVNRPFQKKEGTRYEIFRDEELPLLAKLPDTPYELAEWKQATVQFNYHISVDGMLYSVPYEFIKRKVDVRVTDAVIEIFYNHNRIASQRVEQQSYRSCMGLFKLADKYSDQRLEAACRKALSYTASPSYKSIKNILAAGQDNIDTESQAPNAASTQNKHAITRGADYYRR